MSGSYDKQVRVTKHLIFSREEETDPPNVKKYAVSGADLANGGKTDSWMAGPPATHFRPYIHVQAILTLEALKYFCINHGDQTGFYVIILRPL